MSITNIIAAMLVFGGLVFFHELGHFIVAKKNKVRVYEFAVGMGPSLYKKMYHDTKYSLNLIPMGGYVRMSPLEDEEETCPEEDFLNKKPLQKIAVALAGPAMNILLALLLFILWAGILGTPVNRINEVMDGYPAQAAGLKSGDTIVEVNSVEVGSWQEVITQISKSETGTPIEFKVISKGEEQEKILLIEPIEKDGRVLIGITPAVTRNFSKAVSNGFELTWRVSGEMLLFVKKLFSGRAGTQELSGPIGIVRIVSDSAKEGAAELLFVAGVISLNLAIINLLPIPALDGSRIIFSLVELLRRGKRIPVEWENRINMAGFVFLMGLMIFLTYKDAMRLMIRS